MKVRSGNKLMKSVLMHESCLQHQYSTQFIFFYRFVIPEDTFSDLEDGNTRNLRLIFKTEEGTSVAPTSWLQFNPEKQEVYGL
jgi:hypothetical protein